MIYFSDRHMRTSLSQSSKLQFPKKTGQQYFQFSQKVGQNVSRLTKVFWNDKNKSIKIQVFEQNLLQQNQKDKQLSKKSRRNPLNLIYLKKITIQILQKEIDKQCQNIKKFYQKLKFFKQNFSSKGQFLIFMDLEKKLIIKLDSALEQNNINQSQIKEENLKVQQKIENYANINNQPQYQHLHQSQIKYQKTKIESKIQEKSIKFQANFDAIQKTQVEKYLSQDVSMLWKKIDQLGRNYKNQEAISIVCLDIMNKPASAQQVLQDKIVKEQIAKKVSKNKNEPLKIIEILKNYLELSGYKVTYSKKANAKTQLSIKALSTGFMMNRIKCQQKIEDGETKWTYENISSNPQELSNFIKYYKRKIAKLYDLTQNLITIHQIRKGSIRVIWSTPEGTRLVNRTDSANPNQRLMFIWKTYIIKQVAPVSSKIRQLSSYQNQLQLSQDLITIFVTRLSQMVKSQFKCSIWFSKRNWS